MTGRLIVLAALLVLVPACGMSVGLRPSPSDVGESPALAASAPATTPATAAAPSSVTTAATAPAGTTSIATTAEPSPTTSTTPSASDDTTTTTRATVTTTTAEPVEITTTTEAAETTTTTEDVPPSSAVSIPDLPDIGTVFSTDDAFLTHDCADGDVTITGDAGTYTLTGDCGGLLVKGSFNTIFADRVDAIDLTGTLNAVIYGAGNPAVNDWDGENIVTGG
jgi:hypothetical protein